MFNAEDIRARVRQVPFRPFQVVTAAGDVHDVMHPELIMVGVGDVAIGIPAPNQPGVYSRMTRVAVFHITELRDLPVPVASPNNGSTNS